MELKDFVMATLEQIVEGTAAAQQAIQEKGGIVNPYRGELPKGRFLELLQGRSAARSGFRCRAHCN